MLIGHSSSIASSPGQFSGEMPDAVLRPRFQSFEQRAGKLVERGKPKLGQRVLAGGHGVTIEVDQVDNAEVDLADRIRVVVEQGDHALLVAAGEVEFLLDLAVDGGLVGVRAGLAVAGVDRVDMAADADGNFRVEPAFAAGFAAGVVEDAVAVAEDAVGDELLVRRVLLGLGAVHEEMVRRIEQPLHRGLDTLRQQTMEGPDLLQQRARHHQHLLTGVFRHARRVARRGRPEKRETTNGHEFSRMAGGRGGGEGKMRRDDGHLTETKSCGRRLA